MKGQTKQKFSMRCKLRGTVVEVVVMNHDNDDTFVLSWDFLADKISADKIEEVDNNNVCNDTDVTDTTNNEVSEEVVE